MSPKEEGTPQKAALRDLAHERVAESTQKRELRAMGCCTAATAKEGWLDVREHLRESFPVRGARATSDNMFCVHLAWYIGNCCVPFLQQFRRAAAWYLPPRT